MKISKKQLNKLQKLLSKLLNCKEEIHAIAKETSISRLVPAAKAPKWAMGTDSILHMVSEDETKSLHIIYGHGSPIGRYIRVDEGSQYFDTTNGECYFKRKNRWAKVKV